MTLDSREQMEGNLSQRIMGLHLLLYMGVGIGVAPNLAKIILSGFNRVYSIKRKSAMSKSVSQKVTVMNVHNIDWHAKTIQGGGTNS